MGGFRAVFRECIVVDSSLQPLPIAPNAAAGSRPNVSVPVVSAAHLPIAVLPAETQAAAQRADAVADRRATGGAEVTGSVIGAGEFGVVRGVAGRSMTVGSGEGASSAGNPVVRRGGGRRGRSRGAFGQAVGVGIVGPTAADRRARAARDRVERVVAV